LVLLSATACTSNEIANPIEATPTVTVTQSPEPAYTPPTKYDQMVESLQDNGLPPALYNDPKFVQNAMKVAKQSCKQARKIGMDAFIENAVDIIMSSDLNKKGKKQAAYVFNSGLSVYCPELLN